MYKKIVFFGCCLLLNTACENKSSTDTHLTHPQCIDSQSSCNMTLENYSVDLAFDQLKLKAENPFTLHLLTKGSLPKNLTLSGHIEGENMYMGKIPLFFEPTSQGFSAKSMLGSCSEKKMRWRFYIHATFELAGKKKHLERYFTVESEN